ncbi:MAG: hypothetical protein KW788_00305 [Candidatus Doudnabacteria bacterium]|nr:hypothetical protein [Candidatus Doudnabacteria bacterium]
MAKARILILILVLILCAGVAYFFLHPNSKTQTHNQTSTQNQKSVLEQARDPKYDNFALQGEVTAVGAKSIQFKTHVIQNGASVTLLKTADLTEFTAIILKTKKADGSFEETKITIKDIKVGETLTFYTQTYPFDEGDINPYRIETYK